ncbi:hypothetical protein OAV88_00950 [bacterium]|nr:hypothetical protein [bacterium]
MNRRLSKVRGRVIMNIQRCLWTNAHPPCGGQTRTSFDDYIYIYIYICRAICPRIFSKLLSVCCLSSSSKLVGRSHKKVSSSPETSSL